MGKSSNDRKRNASKEGANESKSLWKRTRAATKADQSQAGQVTLVTTVNKNTNATKFDHGKTRKVVIKQSGAEVAGKNPQVQSGGRSERVQTPEAVPGGSRSIEAENCDHVRVAVNESEDDFTDDEADPMEYNRESGSEAGLDSGDSDDETASSVVESEVILRTQMPDIPAEEIAGLVQHPHFQDYVDRIVTTRVQLALSEAGSSSKDKTEGSPVRAAKDGQGKSSQPQPRNIKSPSDTTIYAPALNFTPDKSGTGVLGNRVPTANDQRISQFLDNMRLQVQSDNGHDVIVANPDSEHLGPACMEQAPGPSAEANDNLNWKDQAREVAGQLVLEAEQSRAHLEVPQGNQVYSDFMDDEFFHITCHVDQATKTKIEQGQFIELDKLLIKDRPFARGQVIVTWPCSVRMVSPILHRSLRRITRSLM